MTLEAMILAVNPQPGMHGRLRLDNFPNSKKQQQSHREKRGEGETDRLVFSGSKLRISKLCQS